MTQYAKLGMQHVQVGLLGTEPAKVAERIGREIVPRLADV